MLSRPEGMIKGGAIIDINGGILIDGRLFGAGVSERGGIADGGDPMPNGAFPVGGA